MAAIVAARRRSHRGDNERKDIEKKEQDLFLTVFPPSELRKAELQLGVLFNGYVFPMYYSRESSTCHPFNFFCFDYIILCHSISNFTYIFCRLLTKNYIAGNGHYEE
jgi:hypothetical protein